ncbi:unnamed protein product, partial [Effrenium voratum]
MSRVDLAIRDAVRSIERGIGGPALKDGFRFEQVTLSLDSKSATKKAAIFTLGVWFLLREIELAALQVKHVAVDEANTIVTVSLSCSKMDTVEQSVHRSHKCYCSYAVLFHARGNHYEEMSKEETISIIREVLGASNIPLLRRGAPLSFIVLMGLRGSRAVERYVQEAQLDHPEETSDQPIFNLAAMQRSVQVVELSEPPPVRQPRMTDFNPELAKILDDVAMPEDVRKYLSVRGIIKDLPAGWWATQVFEGATVGGAKRRFPQQQLLGAEAILGKMVFEAKTETQTVQEPATEKPARKHNTDQASDRSKNKGHGKKGKGKGKKGGSGRHRWQPYHEPRSWQPEPRSWQSWSHSGNAGKDMRQSWPQRQDKVIRRLRELDAESSATVIISAGVEGSKFRFADFVNQLEKNWLYPQAILVVENVVLENKQDKLDLYDLGDLQWPANVANDVRPLPCLTSFTTCPEDGPALFQTSKGVEPLPTGGTLASRGSCAGADNKPKVRRAEVLLDEQLKPRDAAALAGSLWRSLSSAKQVRQRCGLSTLGTLPFQVPEVAVIYADAFFELGGRRVHPSERLPETLNFAPASFSNGFSFAAARDSIPEAPSTQNLGDLGAGVGSGTPCCNFYNSRFKVFCDNLGTVAQFSHCPITPWQCRLFLGEDERGRQIVAEARVWEEPWTVFLLACAGAMFGMLLIFQFLVFLSYYSERLAWLGSWLEIRLSRFGRWARVGRRFAGAKLRLQWLYRRALGMPTAAQEKALQREEKMREMALLIEARLREEEAQKMQGEEPEMFTLKRGVIKDIQERNRERKKQVAKELRKMFRESRKKRVDALHALETDGMEEDEGETSGDAMEDAREFCTV